MYRLKEKNVYNKKSLAVKFQSDHIFLNGGQRSGLKNIESKGRVFWGKLVTILYYKVRTDQL